MARRGSFDSSLANHVEFRKKPKVKNVSNRVAKLQRFAKRLRKLRSMDYSDYLKTNHWKQIRIKAIVYHGRKCNRCGSTDYLQVHHKTYVRKGHEKMTDLELLCRGCHENHHEGEKFGVFDPMTREYLSIVG